MPCGTVCDVTNDEIRAHAREHGDGTIDAVIDAARADERRAIVAYLESERMARRAMRSTTEARMLGIMIDRLTLGMDRTGQ